jgi:hypothetical protein
MTARKKISPIKIFLILLLVYLVIGIIVVNTGKSPIVMEPEYLYNAPVAVSTFSITGVLFWPVYLLSGPL